MGFIGWGELEGPGVSSQLCHTPAPGTWVGALGGRHRHPLDHQHSLWVSLGGCVGSPPRRAVPVSCRGGEERPCEQGCFSQARTLTGFAVCRSLVTWRLVSVAGGLQAVDLAFVSVSWFGATRFRGRLEGMVFGYINVKGI